MQTITTIGLDIAKSVFQVHGVDAEGNLAALCWGIANANRVFDAESVTHDHTIGRPVGAGVEAINKVIAAGTEQALRRYQVTFEGLRDSKNIDTGDEEREKVELPV
jgi:hypothetical protein